MRVQLLFIGTKYIYNEALSEYVLRKVREKFDFISCVRYFKEGDNSLFLHLQTDLNSDAGFIIVTTKQNFSTVGKMLCTVTEDNQILKDEMLIPTRVSVYENKTYLLEHKNAIVNVIQFDEMQQFPQILLKSDINKATIHLFEYSKDAAASILSQMAQTYEVTIETITIIDGWLQIEVTSKKYGNISKFINASKELLSQNLITASNIARHIIEKLSVKHKKITFAESCSGGLLSYYFTKQNGASKILEGALVTYSNSIKENWLAVQNETLQKYGAVSEDVVIQMSEGALSVSNADYALAISGIAGESGGTKEKPVGTIHICVSSKTHQAHMHLKLDGDRNYIQQQSVLFAIKMLILIDKELFF